VIKIIEAEGVTKGAQYVKMKMFGKRSENAPQPMELSVTPKRQHLADTFEQTVVVRRPSDTVEKKRRLNPITLNPLTYIDPWLGAPSKQFTLEESNTLLLGNSAGNRRAIEAGAKDEKQVAVRNKDTQVAKKKTTDSQVAKKKNNPSVKKK
jgi:hypothetical protein